VEGGVGVKIKSKAILIDKLMKLAESPANDAVRLAFMDGAGPGEIKGLDLSAVTEFKRGGNGSVEVKFIDRVEALKWLSEQGVDPKAERLYRALEKGNERMNNE